MRLRYMSQVVLAIAMIEVVLAASIALAVMTLRLSPSTTPPSKVLALAGSPEVGDGHRICKLVLLLE